MTAVVIFWMELESNDLWSSNVAELGIVSAHEVLVRT